MRTAVLIACFMIIGGICAVAETRQGPDWVRINEQADWQPRDSAGEFVFDEHIWILGGWVAADLPNPRDVWKSPDGVNWTCTVEEAPWEYSDLSAVMVYDERMWLMGGRKLPGAANTNEVWSSRDGAAWVLETEDPGWCERVSPSFEVFNDRIWLMGGSENFYRDDDETLKNDVWSTVDGVQWRLETESAAWPKRTHAQAIVFDGKLWLMGGGRWHPETVPLNDVWSSDDGVNWECVTESAPWDPRMWFSLVVYRDHLWLLGGWNREHGNYGDVWYTKDGKNWTEVEFDVIWDARHEHSTVVFEDRIWVMGGYGAVLTSDIWTLEIPEDWFDED